MQMQKRKHLVLEQAVAILQRRAERKCHRIEPPLAEGGNGLLRLDERCRRHDHVGLRNAAVHLAVCAIR